MESEGSRVIVIIVLSMLFYVSTLGPKPLQDWRAAAKYINSINISGKFPTLVYPGLMEQRKWSLTQKPEKQKYLLAPFSFYHLKAKSILLPLIPDKLKLEALFSQNDISMKNHKNEIYLILRIYMLRKQKCQRR